MAQTPGALVWRVSRADGQPAALKYYPRGGMGNEIGSIAYLARAGNLAVPILDHSSDAVLMGWCEGASLAEQARKGDPREADRELGRIAGRLAARHITVEGLQPLEQFFSALLQGRFHDPNLQEAQALALLLFAREEPEVALHGDLHFDNVLWSGGGWQVIDAKGLYGARAYELANAFRHPRGCGDYLLNPGTIDWRLENWSGALGCSARMLCQWAAVKTALSLIWSNTAQDRVLLAALLDRLRICF